MKEGGEWYPGAEEVIYRRIRVVCMKGQLRTREWYEMGS